jgi:alkylation response protein AidB-like acyl-CoA dehydrogenase
VNLELSLEQRQLRDTVRRFLTDRASITGYTRPMLGDEQGWSPAVWQAEAELGLTGLMVSADHGGAGAGITEAGLVIEEMGRVAHPGPYLSTAVGAAVALARFGHAEQCHRILPGLASGAATVSVAIGEPTTRTRWHTPATIAEHRAGRWELTGTKVDVLDPGADQFIVTASSTDGLGTWLIGRNAPGVTIATIDQVDPSRRFGAIRLQRVAAERIGRSELDAHAALDEVIDAIAIGFSSDALGAAGAAFELAVEYAKVREQFDRPIGSFQAVQHLCADMFCHLELARSALCFAWWAFDCSTPEDRRRGAWLSQVASGRATAITEIAIQVLGGIGFTWEHDVHLLYKRTLSAASFRGGPTQAQEGLGRRLASSLR